MSEMMERLCAAVAARQSGDKDTGIRAKERVRNFADGDKQVGIQGGRRCYDCGGPHLVLNCPKKDRGVREVKCWTCGGI